MRKFLYPIDVHGILTKNKAIRQHACPIRDLYV